MKQLTLLHACTPRCSSYADCLGTRTAYLASFVEYTYESSDTSIYIKKVRVPSYVNLVYLFKTLLLIIRGIVIFVSFSCIVSEYVRTIQHGVLVYLFLLFL